MNSEPENLSAEIPASAGLFLGDQGNLPLETRRALAQLLVGPSLEERRHSNLWPVLLRDEAMIRSRLGDLFLELVIDPDAKVAFIRQAECGDIEVPKLLRRAPLTFIDSALLLFLRQQLARFENQGERAAVSIEEAQDHLSAYEPSDNTDRAGFVKRCQAAIEKMKGHSILRKIRGSEERYEISPTLKLLLSAEEIQGLVEVYRKIKENGFVSGAEVEPDDPESQGEPGEAP